MVSDPVRQRKLISSNDKDKSTKRSRNKSAALSNNNLKFSFGCLVLCVVILVTVFGIYTDTVPPLIDQIALRLGYREKQFAVILDAGSTGSRVLAYEFHLGYLDRRLILDNEIFVERKPGLSSFAHATDRAADNILELLDEAKRFVPKVLWPTTPVTLKATAGLRLLEPESAEQILHSVRHVIEKSGFRFTDKSVEIMDGTDEGIFSWFTVNFLLDRLNGHNTVAALDLGGGSTQVTFSPKDLQKTPSFNEFMHKVPTGNSASNNENDAYVEVFTNSYLGLGLMAGRYVVLSNGQEKDAKSLVSECVNPIIVNKPWKYGNVEYTVSGKDNLKSTSVNPVVDFERCLSLVKQKVVPLVKPKPITLKQSQISAFSYYFDRAIEIGLVDPFLGGEIEVSKFLERAKEICAEANTDQPFMCLDVTFISVLLEDGFGLTPQTKLKLFKKIGGHEISWALGCAYNLLTNSADNA